MIAALYIQESGCYTGLPGVDPWPESRDARKYSGPWPVVAHAPCARWCRLAGLVEKRHGHKKGEDGGCFEAALRCVRAYGGILEHPAYSDAFVAYGLPIPSAAGWQLGTCGGWVCQVDQGHFGHRARKPTWLYAFGVGAPPSLPWGPSKESSACVSLGFRDTWKRRAGGEVQQMSKRQRSATPIAFRDLLIGIARSAHALKAVA
jgi:hypothetical protein